MISDDASALKRFENYFDAETRDARVCLDNKMPPKNSPTAKEFIKRCRQENPEILINSHPRVTRASCEDFQFPEVQKLYREFCDIRGRGVKGTADYIQGLKKRIQNEKKFAQQLKRDQSQLNAAWVSKNCHTVGMQTPTGVTGPYGRAAEGFMGTWRGEYKNSEMPAWKSGSFTISGGGGGYQASFPAGTIPCQRSGATLACKGTMSNRYYHDKITLAGDRVVGVTYFAWDKPGGRLLWKGNWRNFRR